MPVGAGTLGTQGNNEAEAVGPRKMGILNSSFMLALMHMSGFFSQTPASEPGSQTRNLLEAGVTRG